jgi:hypothetical protein
VIIYSNPDDGPTRKNRGFCFVEFTEHKFASDAKRKLTTAKAFLWKIENLVVDWAEPQDEPAEDVMSKV